MAQAEIHMKEYIDVFENIDSLVSSAHPIIPYSPSRKLDFTQGIKNSALVKGVEALIKDNT